MDLKNIASVFEDYIDLIPKSMYDGKLLKILDHDEIDEHTVMMYSTNAVQAMEE